MASPRSDRGAAEEAGVRGDSVVREEEGEGAMEDEQAAITNVQSLSESAVMGPHQTLQGGFESLLINFNQSPL